MSSGLGSAVTPGGHMALGDLLQSQAQRNALAEQSMARRSGEDLAWAGMAQSQQQQQAQLGALQQSQQSQQEHQMRMSQLGYEQASSLQRDQQEHQKAQDQALMAWQRRQSLEQQRMQLQIEALHAKAEQAYSEGDLGARERVVAELVDLRRRQAAAAARVAVSSRLVGRTREQMQRILDDTVSHVERAASTEKMHQRMGASESAVLVDRLVKADIDSAIHNIRSFRSQQETAGSLLNPAAGNYADIEGMVQSGQLPGVEWLRLAPTDTDRLDAAISGANTVSRYAVAGTMDAAMMADTIRSQVRNALVDQLTEKGLPGFHREKASRLADMVLSGSADRGQIARAATEIGVPTSMLRWTLANAADQFEGGTASERYRRLVELEAQIEQRNGGQDSLERQAVQAARTAWKTRGSILRRAASQFDDMDLSQYEHVIQSLGALKSGHGSADDVASLLRSSGQVHQADDLLRSWERSRSSEDDLAQAARDQESLSSREAGVSGDMSLLDARSRVRAGGTLSKGLDDLIRGLPQE